MKNISFGRTSRAHYATEVVNFYRDKKIKFVEKCENPANVPEVRAIEDFWSILKSKVYEKGWEALDLSKLKWRIRYCLRKMDLDLVYRLLAGTSARLNKVRMYGLIEDRE
jgi:DNA-directed RNA polymerase alpha subunit